METKKNLIFFLMIGSAYYLLRRYTHFAIHCPFRTISGYLCPGCGITTMIMALGRFDFIGAYYANPFLFITLPFIVFETVYMLLGKRSKKNDIAVWVYVGLLVIYGVLRNIFIW